MISIGRVTLTVQNTAALFLILTDILYLHYCVHVELHFA